jgi:vacuolar-type H+-ATPase subunit D/Vma8|tara:strand:- start:5247 stop:5540 length:294 start_codon:yes stop_codon:yes gene_type:complete
MNLDPTALIELNGKLERMMDSLDAMKEKQEEMATGISRIKEAVYNPDEGVYARIKECEAQIKELENWKSVHSRLIWIVVTSLAGLAVASAYANIVAG